MGSRLAAHNNRRKSLAGAEQHFLHPDRLRNKIAVAADEIKSHSLDFQAEKSVGPNIANLPELRLTRSDGNVWRHHAIYRHKFLVIGSHTGMVLNQNNY